MQMEQVNLTELTTKTKKVKVCVRVMRKWVYCGNDPDGPPLYVGLVLADQQV